MQPGGKYHSFENMIVLGGIFGTIMSVFTDISLPVGHWLLYVYGFCAGIFVGCIAVALAEILNTFPIIFRRFQIKEGLSWIIFVYGIWKMCRSVLVFWTSHDTALMQKGQSGENIFTGICQKDKDRDIVIWSAWYLTKT